MNNNKLILFIKPLLFLAVVISNVNGQKSKIVETGVIGGVPYASTDFENINMTNGNLNLSFPLASLQGRGGAGFGYYMTYNSKLWQTVSNPVYNPFYQPNPTYQNFLADNIDGGWRVGDAYELNVWNRQSGMDAPTGNVCDLNIRWMLVHQWKVTINFPDGRKVEFRPTGYSDVEPGNPGIGTGYFAVQPNGSVNTVVGSSSNCTHQSSPPTYERMTYYSSDGSGIRLTFANGEPLGFVWEMSMPDGSKVAQISGGGQRITDRNGNYVQQTTITLPDATQASGWVDQVGRYVARKEGTGPDEDTYYQLGFDGELLTWKVKWKNVHVLKNYVTTCITCPPNERGPVIDTQAMMEFRVVDQIILPDQLGVSPYDFEYHAKDQEDQNLSSGWGEVKSISMPSGASINYGYKLSALSESEAYNVILPGEIFQRVDQILERAGTLNKKKLVYIEEYDDDTNQKEEIWHYGTGRSGSGVTAPDGSMSQQFFWDIVNDEQKGGQVYKEIRSDGTIVEKVWGNNLPVGVTFGSGAHLNAFVKTEFSTIPDAAGNPALTAIKDFNFDRNGNLLEIAEYDWIPASSPAILRDSGGKVTGFAGLTPARSTETTYYSATPEFWTQTVSANAYYLSTAPALRNLVETTEIKDAGGTPKSRTEIVYDGSAAPVNGNPTEVKTWDSHKNGTLQAYSAPLNSNNSVSVLTQYDPYGNPTLISDAKGYQTEISYGPVNGFTGLYPTQTKTAFGTPVQRTSTAIYDFQTGAIKTATDTDNNVSVVTERDALGRPTKVRNAAGTSLESWTRTEYNDAARRIIVRFDLSAVGDEKKVVTQFLDQLGRVRLSKTLEDAATQSATNETDGIKVQTRYMFSAPCTFDVAKTCTSRITSRPFRANYSYNAEAESAMGWSRTQTRADGKHGEAETFSGSALPQPFLSSGYNTNASNSVKTDIDADRTLVTDPAGKQRITRANGLGQLTDVWEVTANDFSTESVAFPGYSGITHGYRTSYGYDILSNLTDVIQGVQTRGFTYSSLSRLTSATNPESGAVNYQYDNNGNLAVKTDSRNVSTHFAYDALNRPIRKWYNGSNSLTATTHNSPAIPSGTSATDEVRHEYDTGANGKGHLASTSTGAMSGSTWHAYSRTELLNRDVLGRPRLQRQWINWFSQAYFDVNYDYNLDGKVNSIEYPSGHTSDYTYDAMGRLSTFTGNLGDGSPRTYSDSFEYTSSNALQQERFGTQTQLYHKQRFNTRGQLWDMRLSTVSFGADSANGDRGSIVNYYDSTFTAGGSGADNNGNLLRQDINIPGNGFLRQSYSYDLLNRMTAVTEKLNGVGGDSFNQTFNYDRWGNRTIDASATLNAPEPQFDVQTSTNRLYSPGENLTLPCTNPADTQRKMCYDAAGNLIREKHLINAGWMTYNAENRMTHHTAGYGDPTVYFYDGDGKRIEIYTDYDGSTRFIYGLGGELLYEVADNAVAKEYGYRNGDLLVTATVAAPNQSDVRWLIKDHLGTPRMVVDKTGSSNAITRHDYLPFGEEILAGIGSRTTGQGYTNNDGTRQRFTGYEHDSESGLDYAGARYLSSRLGRFTTADPVGISLSRLVDPQQINLFSYVRNNPSKFNDPDGRDLKLKQGMKQVDQDRIIKNLVRQYRRESGRKAIEQLEKSDITHVVGSGELKSNRNALANTVQHAFGRTESNAAGTKDLASGKYVSVDTPRKDVTITITVDFEKLDTQESLSRQDGRSITGPSGVPPPPAESVVFDDEVGHALDMDNDLLKEANKTDKEAHAFTKTFADKLKDEKKTLSEEEAEGRVREILNLPEKKKKKD